MVPPAVAAGAAAVALLLGAEVTAAGVAGAEEAEVRPTRAVQRIPSERGRYKNTPARALPAGKDEEEMRTPLRAITRRYIYTERRVPAFPVGTTGTQKARHIRSPRRPQCRKAAATKARDMPG